MAHRDTYDEDASATGLSFASDQSGLRELTVACTIPASTGICRCSPGRR
ncbi:MAG: hypothetical protein ACRDQ9_03400 [Pseudonocardiaceae bacterium]